MQCHCHYIFSTIHDLIFINNEHGLWFRNEVQDNVVHIHGLMFIVDAL